MKRKLIRVTEDIENECYAGKESLESVLDKTEHDVFALLSSRTETHTRKLLLDLVPSHPVWVRGLKLIFIGQWVGPFGVAPRVGAWIETRPVLPDYPC